MLSAIIIAKDEEMMIEECLRSLSFADEIVLIDSGSTDNTVKIAKKHKARVVNFKQGNNFSEWRNKGLSEAKGDWILYIDADERVSEELSKEILEVISDQSETGAYAIPRKNNILGKNLIHGGWYPDYVKRLFKKGSISGWHGDLHEEPKYTGQIGHLKCDLIHIKHETFSEMIDKTNKWSGIEAKLMFEANHPPMNIVRFMTAMWREFWYRMIVKRAFLDGKVGIVFAIYQVFSRFVSYAKLWEMQLTK